VIGRVLGAASPAMASLLVPTDGCHARYLRMMARTSHLARLQPCMAYPIGSCALITFNIRKPSYGFKPFFYAVSREIFQCQRCFFLDTLNIFNYCLYSYCRRVSAETLRRPGLRSLGRRALQDARRTRAEGELTCRNVPGLSLTTSSQTSLRSCSTICLPPG
jgi:hypothetical protein